MVSENIQLFCGTYATVPCVSTCPCLGVISPRIVENNVLCKVIQTQSDEIAIYIQHVIIYYVIAISDYYRALLDLLLHLNTIVNLKSLSVNTFQLLSDTILF